MIWKMIGRSVAGLSHIQSGKACDDAVCYRSVDLPDGGTALVCFASDGAGSAKYAAVASQLVTEMALATVMDLLQNNVVVSENELYVLTENLFDTLKKTADEQKEQLNEYSCTLLGCIVLPDSAYFLQIGDGAIIRNDGNGSYTYIWWPHNGEYQNTTSFLADSKDMRHLKITALNEPVTEVAVFTDGLQMLALNNETISVHQPFFKDMFHWLRMASQEAHIDILNKKLKDYLDSSLINSRTDDDKTLFLATRLNNDNLQGNG